MILSNTIRAVDAKLKSIGQSGIDKLKKRKIARSTSVHVGQRQASRSKSLEVIHYEDLPTDPHLAPFSGVSCDEMFDLSGESTKSTTKSVTDGLCQLRSVCFRRLAPNATVYCFQYHNVQRCTDIMQDARAVGRQDLRIC